MYYNLKRIDSTGFEWTFGNYFKVQKHGLRIEEIERFFDQELFVLADNPHSLEEKRKIAVGSINKRAAFVVFTIRKYGEQVFIRVISARYVHEKEIKIYEKLKKENA